MGKRLLYASFSLAILCIPSHLWAQFTEAHNYDNTPVGLNQIELAYGYARSDASIDTSLIVEGARFSLNQGTVSYLRTFGVLQHLAWVEASVPVAGLGGSINGTNIHGSATGAGDSSYTVSALLKGGPALNVAQFADYKPTTIIGMSLTISAPTGQYDPNRLLNLGSDRWSFKPEIALSQPFGREQKWQCDLYAKTYFFTDNTSYRGTQILRQDPLPAFEGHLSYSFLNNLWASVDGFYSFRGDTQVNGVSQDSTQKNFILGSEVSMSVTAQHTLAVQFGKALVHENGPAYTGFVVKYSYTWGKGYR
jgi:hypothetical protein